MKLEPHQVSLSDLTDAQWALIAPFLPVRTGPGRPRGYSLRLLVNAMLYLRRTGGPWRMRPRDYPQWQAVRSPWAIGRRDGGWERRNAARREQARAAAGRAPPPTAGVIDRQRVKPSEAGGERGFDGGKKGVGRKRPIATDTPGQLLAVTVTPAAVPDVDGAYALLPAAPAAAPTLAHGGVDGGEAGDWAAWVQAEHGVRVEGVRRPPGTRGFVVQARRWVGERTRARLTRHRRLTRDCERYDQPTEALLYLAACHLLLKRLTPASE